MAGVKYEYKLLCPYHIINGICYNYLKWREAEMGSGGRKLKKAWKQ